MTENLISQKVHSSRDLAPLDARAVTRLRVLNHIRDAKEVSRTNISAALKLSPATVTFVTSALIAGGLVEEVQNLEAPDNFKRGRPRVALCLAKNRFHIAGIKVAREQMSILILDFNGDEVAKHIFEHSKPRMTPAEFIAEITIGLESACKDLDRGIGSLAGVSIGLAGQIDASRKFVHWSSSLEGRNIELGPLFDEHLACAAFIENDANLVAKAEQLFGEDRESRNFLVVTIEHGVGLGIILDGTLHRGQRGCGAEFGHTKVELNGAKCQCEQYGCLEAYVGVHGLLRRAREALGEGRVGSVRELVQYAGNGDAQAQKILEEAGQIMGVGLANLINLFDPERIILYGAPHRVEHLVTDEVFEQITRNVVTVDAPLPEIAVRHGDDFMWARGAAAMGIEQVSALKVKELAQ